MRRKKQGKQEPQTNNQNPISGDDQRIENITVAWATPDDVEDNSPARLSLVPKADEFSVKMKLSVALSGQYSYKEGEIQIVVPKYIFADRDGKPAGELEAAVPEAPSQQSTFAYTEMDDSYVLSNTCEFSAATQASFEFAVRKLDPIELVGNGQLADGEKAHAADALPTEVEKYVTDNFYGTVNLTTHAGNVLSMTSNKLDASVDTQEAIAVQSCAARASPRTGLPIGPRSSSPPMPTSTSILTGTRGQARVETKSTCCRDRPTAATAVTRRSFWA